MNDSTSAISPVWPTRWPKDSFKGFWTWLLAGFISLLFVALFVFSVSHNQVPKSVDPVAFDMGLIAQFVLEGLLVGIVLLALPRLSKFSLTDLGFRAPSAANVAVAVLGAVAMFVVANGSADLLNYATHTDHQQDVVEIFRALHNPPTIALFAAFAVIFAPFAEETLFRLFFFNLGMRYGGFWGGAILSGALFGVAHGDIFEALPLALGGIVLCVVYYRTRNAFSSMISHALFNSFSIVLLLAFPKLTA